ncbi:junctional adhesion molecule A-like [Kryptolebias marmoratus]|uniref:junctional adhesion molecule A-like n=1 Tax=Kryptolebias marmoratus TaxID=37003 RepID=UPI000D5304FA|nr:junctional adhesion molecule A-like [Kryptolebias marmoratus]
MLWFYVMWVPLFTAYGDVLYANLGDDVSLPCFFTSSATHLSWYKQVAGEQPRIISSFYKSSLNSNIFYNQFKDNRRFSVDTGGGFYNLNISNIQDSDSAMYSCSYTRVSVTIFISGTFLVLKNSSCRSVLEQPVSDSVQPGNSVTLNCTLLTGTSDGEHSAYWFKDSGKSHLGMLYTSSRQCVRSSEWGSPALRCVYSLSKRNVSLFDAGTYYCAVASCGQILFGTGTRLSVEGNQQLLVHGVVAALVVSLIANIILCSSLCHVSRRKKLHSKGSHHQPETTPDPENEGFTVVQYAALDFKKRQDRSSRQKNTEEETIYSRVRRSELE